MTLMQTFILLCGLAAVLYGLITSRQILSLSSGNEKMVEIAGAIQEGARAYLNRQYLTIGIVGVVIFVLIWLVFDLSSGVGFLIAMVLFTGVRSTLEYAKPPKSFEGLPITLVAASMVSVSFMGFGGIVESIFGTF